MTLVIVTALPFTKKLSLVVVTTPGLLLLTLRIFPVTVPLVVQDKFPVPSVSKIKPKLPPFNLTLDTLPKAISPPASPPRLTQLFPS